MDLSFPVSEEALAQFKAKMSEGIQHAKDNATTGSMPNATGIEATLIKLVGAHITSPEKNFSLKDFTSFVASHVSITEYGRVALTDALWFWGTQVRL